MAHSQKQIDADAAAVKNHRCPETGRDLRPMTKEQIVNYAKLTFHDYDTPRADNEDHIRRYNLLVQYVADRFHEVK